MFILTISLLSAKTYLISHLWLSWSNNLERLRVSSTVWLSRRKKQSLSSCYNVYFKFICDLYSCHKHMQLPVKSFRLSLWLSPWCLYLEKAGFFDKWVYPVKTQYQLIGLHTCSWSFIIFVKEPHGWFSCAVCRCLLLVLESSRVEVAVLLNDLAYMKYEASSSSSAAETIPLKQQNLAISFSLLEKIIKLISNVCGVNGKWTHHI